MSAISKGDDDTAVLNFRLHCTANFHYVEKQNSNAT